MDSRHERYQSLINQIKEHSISKEELKSAIEAAEFDDEQLHQLYLAAVTHLMSEKSIGVFRIIPEKYRTHAICLAAAKVNATSRLYFPKDVLKNYDILLEIVRHQGQDLEEVPLSMRDLNICLAAIGEKNIFALPFIPEAFLEHAGFKTAIAECRENIPKHGFLLKYLPASLRDLDICIAAARQNWETLQFVPEALLEHEEFKDAIAKVHEAIKKDWEIIHKIPPTFITQDDCMAVIKGKMNMKYRNNLGEELACIPIKFRNYNLLKEAASDYWSTHYLPKHLKNYQTETNLNKDECELLWIELIKSGIAQGELPKELLTSSFCQKILTERKELSSMLIEHLQDYSNTTTLSKQEYREVILPVVKQHGINLKHVPVDMRDYEICVWSVKKDGLALEIIQDYERTTTLNADQFKSICLAAVSQNARALDFAPVTMRNIDICLACVNQSGLLLEKIKEYQTTTALTENEFRSVCQAAVANSFDALNFVPEKFLTTDFFLEAIANSMQGKEMLSWINEHKDIIGLSQDDYLKIAIAAVENNPMALELVDKKIKTAVIDALTPQKILSINIGALVFFPTNPDYQAAIDQLLTDVRHVVVTGEHFDTDNEIRDTYLVYANSPQRAGKTLHTTKENLDHLLAEIKKNHVNADRQINLVLLGHAATSSTQLAGITASEMTQLLKNHDSLSRITLLACNTAKSRKPEQEKEMIKKYRDKVNLPKDGHHPCSVILMSRMPTPDEYPTLLTRMRIDSKKQESDRTYILVKSNHAGKEQHDLIYIQKNPISNEPVIETKYSLDPEQLGKLGKVIGNKAGKIPFPGKNKPPLYFRGGKGSEFLTDVEFQKITDITIKEGPQFTKAHSQYKKHKTEYPFLTSFEIKDTEEAEAKLMPSLLKTFHDAIKSDPDITREIVIKGYTKPLHVDTQTKQMTAVYTYAYTSQYRRSKAPFFYKDEATIERRRQKYEHDRYIEDMQKDDPEDKTIAKSIKVVINPKLK